jgi:hypothetical protein
MVGVVLRGQFGQQGQGGEGAAQGREEHRSVLEMKRAEVAPGRRR